MPRQETRREPGRETRQASGLETRREPNQGTDAGETRQASGAARDHAGECRPLGGTRRRSRNAELIDTLRLVSPGTSLREGMDSILSGHTGALIVVGDGPEVRALLDGGFRVDAPFTPAALYELSKMDGGIILTEDASRILHANVQLNPDPAMPSHETGIRHRTAERVARQTNRLVVAVSSRRNVITVYRGDLKYILRDISFILDKANEAVEVLERYRASLYSSLGSLTALEFEDLVTVHDFSAVLQKSELVLNVAEEIEKYAAELGSEGRLISIQMSEVVPEVEKNALLIIRDYWNGPKECSPEDVQERLRDWSADGLLELPDIASLLGYRGGEAALGLPVSPRGYRVLHEVPHLPASVPERVVARFGNLQRVLGATLAELDAVEGIGEARARAVKENLRRAKEQALLSKLS